MGPGEVPSIYHSQSFCYARDRSLRNLPHTLKQIFVSQSEISEYAPGNSHPAGATIVFHLKSSGLLGISLSFYITSNRSGDTEHFRWPPLRLLSNQGHSWNIYCFFPSLVPFSPHPRSHLCKMESYKLHKHEEPKNMFLRHFAKFVLCPRLWGLSEYWILISDSLFLNPEYSDLTIFCGNEAFPVHKIFVQPVLNQLQNMQVIDETLHPWLSGLPAN